MTTAPAPEEREILFRDFAKALFKSDMDALYRVVTPDFLWLYHDGVLVTKLLSGAETIKAHLAEQKIPFSEQRFHEVSYHHLLETTFMTFRVSETVAGSGELREQRGIEHYTFRDGRIATRLSKAVAVTVPSAFRDIRAGRANPTAKPPAVAIDREFSGPGCSVDGHMHVRKAPDEERAAAALILNELKEQLISWPSDA